MWFIIALIVGIVIGTLVLWTRSKDIKLAWYEWLIGIVGLLLLLFGLQNYFAVGAELESTAATLFLLVIALPGLILMLVAWQLVARRQRTAKA